MSRRTIQFENWLYAEARAEWDAYWASSNHSAPRQNACYGEVELSEKHRAVYVIGRIDGKVAFIGLFGLIPFISPNAFSEAVCARGPVFDDVSFGEWCLGEILRYFSRQRVGHVRIGPNWAFPEAKKTEAMLFGLGFKIFAPREWPLGRRQTGIVSIDSDDQIILDSFSKYTRRQIRLAERLGIQIIEATSQAQAEEFFVNLKRFREKKGLGSLTRRGFFAIFDHVFKDGKYGVLLSAYSESAYLGGLSLTRDKRTIYADKLVIADLATQKCPTLRLAPILYFHGMRWGKLQGCSALDFDGYSANVEGAGELALVYLGKKGFRPTELMTLDQYVAVNRAEIALATKTTRAISRVINYCKKAMS